MRKAAARRLSPRGINIIAAATAVLHDPVQALGVFGIGHAIRGVQKSVAERALRNEKFVSWALRRDPGGTLGQVAGSLTALAAEKELIERRGGLVFGEYTVARVREEITRREVARNEKRAPAPDWTEVGEGEAAKGVERFEQIARLLPLNANA